MAKKYIFRISEIKRRRSFSWDEHYKLREIARSNSAFDAFRVVDIIARYLPPPDMDSDGSLVQGLLTVRGRWRATEILRLTPTIENLHLMCVWYWSESSWMDFVKLFNALPDVTEDHYLYYDKIRDAGLLFPLSYKPVDKFRGSRGEVGEFPRVLRKNYESVTR